MLLLLIIPLLVSGFITSHIHPYYYYKLHRHEGQYLYIHTAYLGLECFSISLALNIIAHKILLTLGGCIPFLASHINYIASIIESSLLLETKESIRVSWYVSIAFCSVAFVPSILSKMYRWRLSKQLGTTSETIQNVYITQQILKDSPLDSFLLDAILQEQLVMLSMKDRKVYVGTILSMGEPNETQAADQEISIRPVFSGFRCKDMLTVTFNTRYKAINQALVVVLRQEDIISATDFDEDVFNQFQSVAKKTEEASESAPSANSDDNNC